MAEEIQESSRKTALQQLHAHACANPARPMLHWLDNKGDVAYMYTRGELWHRARLLADDLVRQGVKAGDMVVNVFPFGLEFMVGIVALWRVGAIAVSVHPPNPAKLKTDIPRLQHFVDNCGAKVALTTAKYRTLVRASSVRYKWPKLTWITVDSKVPRSVTTLPVAPGDVWVERGLDNTALVQYTSGSTGNPKGIEITHGNIAHQFEAFAYTAAHSGFADSTELRGVHFIPHSHDMGLLLSFLSTLALGHKGFFMNPQDFIRNPPLFPRCIERYEGNFTNGPSFAFSLAAKRLASKGETTDCSRVRICILGGEASDITMLADAEKVLGLDPAAVYNCWGLAEQTLCATQFGTKRIFNGQWSAGSVSGAAGVGIHIRVVNAATRELVPDGVEGELWLHSASVAKGYMHHPELTQQTFHAKLHGASGEDAEREWLRTGDAGVISDDDLFILSRIKDLIIVNGRNYAPSDLERSAEHNFKADIRPGCSVAFQRAAADGKEVVLVCELRSVPDRSLLPGLAAKVREHVEREEGVAVAHVTLVAKGTVSKTTSGKVQRNKTKDRWEAGELKTLADAERSALDSAHSLEELFVRAGVAEWDATLMENGIDSLKLSELAQTASDRFNVDVEFDEAGSLSARELLARLLRPASSGSSGGNGGAACVELPGEPYDATTDAAPSACKVVFAQTFVVVVVLLAVAASFSPAAYFVATYFSPDEGARWLVNGRAGPMVAVAVVLWMATYSCIVVVLKWLLLLGRLQSGASMKRWSWLFTRWWTLQLLAGIWEYAVGVGALDTPLANIFYKLLGANVAMSARLTKPLRDWDLVNVGAGASCSGSLFPHMFRGMYTHLARVEVREGANVGADAVVQAGAVIGESAVVEEASLVVYAQEIEAGATYSGVPCRCVPVAEAGSGSGSGSGWFASATITGGILRLATTVAHFAMWLGLYNLLARALPAATALELASEPWTSTSVGYIIAAVGILLLTGLVQLAVLVALKWLFVLPPYVLDRWVALLLDAQLRFVSKSPFALGAWKLFGLTVGSGSVAYVGAGAFKASEAHLVTLGPRCFFSMCTFAPKTPAGVARTVWGWLAARGGLKSPWSAVGCGDISVPAGAQLGIFSRIESGAILEDGAGGASSGTRLRAGDVVEAGHVAVGNPFSIELAAAQTARPGPGRRGSRSIKRLVKPHLSTPEMRTPPHRGNLKAVVRPHQSTPEMGTPPAIDKLQASKGVEDVEAQARTLPEESQHAGPPSALLVWVLWTAYAIIFCAVLASSLFAFVVAVQVALAAPIHAGVPSYGTAPLAFLIWFGVFNAILVVLLITAANVVGPCPEKVPVASWSFVAALGVWAQRGAASLCFDVFFAGLAIKNAAMIATGFDVDLTAFVSAGSFVTFDAAYVRIGRWSVIDSGADALAHETWNGNVKLQQLTVGERVVLHPYSRFIGKTMASDAMILPKSRALSPTALAAGKIILGLPARPVRALEPPSQAVGIV